MQHAACISQNALEVVDPQQELRALCMPGLAALLTVCILLPQ
jgi:hypothetical protein